VRLVPNELVSGVQMKRVLPLTRVYWRGLDELMEADLMILLLSPSMTE